jgi:hypothetical protein
MSKLDAQKLAEDKKLAKELEPGGIALPSHRDNNPFCKVGEDQPCQQEAVAHSAAHQ